MATKIRLARRGRKKLAMFDVVIADSRAPRDGKFIQKIGTYNPNTNPASINIDNDKALDWLMKGAQPTDTVRAMLSYRGVMLKKHLQIGVNKGAITQEEEDKRFDDWKQQKEASITSKVDQITKQQEDAHKARMEAERKVKEARAEAIQKKNVVEEEAPAEEATATAEEATDATETVEASAETPATDAPENAEDATKKEEA